MLLRSVEAGAEFVIVGGHALAVHGVSRATIDLDIFVRPDPANADRVLRALHAFGAPTRAHGLTRSDLEREGTVYQLGLPPNRIDVITAIDGVTFDQAWSGRVLVAVDGLPTPFIGLDELLANKRAAARAKDIADVAALVEVRQHRRPA